MNRIQSAWVTLASNLAVRSTFGVFVWQLFGGWAMSSLPLAFAQDDPSTPQKQDIVSIRWTGNSGAFEPFGWRYFSEWVWVDASAETPVPYPILKTYIEVPKGAEWIGFKAAGIRDVPRPQDGPFKEAVSYGSEKQNVTGVLQYRPNLTDRPISRAFILEAKPPHSTRIWQHETCKEIGVHLKEVPKNPQALYFASIHCEEKSSAWVLTVVYSREAQESDFKSAVAKKSAIGANWFRVEIEKEEYSKIQASSSGLVARFSLRTNSLDSHFDLVAKPAVPLPRRFSVSGGIGISAIRFTDTRIGSLNEFALTGKLGVKWRFWRPHLEVGLDSFMNVIAFASSREEKAQFLGVNARLGYRLPWPPYPFSITIHGGGYYSLMIITRAPGGDTFGYRDLIGPQLYPSFDFTWGEHSGIGLYFKYSPLGGVIGARASAAELASGLHYRRKLWGNWASVSFDFARLGVFFPDTDTHIDTMNASLGLGYAY